MEKNENKKSAHVGCAFYFISVVNVILASLIIKFLI